MEGSLLIRLNPARASYSMDHPDTEIEEILNATHHLSAKRSIKEHAEKVTMASAALTEAFGDKIEVEVDWESLLSSPKMSQSNVDRVPDVALVLEWDGQHKKTPKSGSV